MSARPGEHRANIHAAKRSDLRGGEAGRTTRAPRRIAAKAEIPRGTPAEPGIGARKRRRSARGRADCARRGKRRGSGQPSAPGEEARFRAAKCAGGKAGGNPTVPRPAPFFAMLPTHDSRKAAASADAMAGRGRARRGHVRGARGAPGNCRIGGARAGRGRRGDRPDARRARDRLAGGRAGAEPPRGAAAP